MRLVAQAEGLTGVRILEYPPPNIAVQNRAQIFEYAERLLDTVIERLTTLPPGAQAAATPKQQATDIVFRGDLDAVNEFVREKIWSDGLPVMPPTLAAVRDFLRFTDRAPDEVIGKLRPRLLAATVWKIAVNGVMAGCRPEYMPVLIAIAEAISEPRFAVENVGSTVGWTPLIILNGPIIKQLGFHFGQGVLRPQHQANISVSRFLRLLLVNVAGYRLGETDMATFGRNYYPVLAEDEDSNPWHPLSVDRGFAKGQNIVTVQSADVTSHSFLSEGDALHHLKVIAHEMSRELGGPMLVPMENFGGHIAPVLGLTPLVSNILADEGWTKQAVKEYLYEHALVPAWEFDDRLDRHERGLTLAESVRRGKLSARFHESDDPDRLVPVLHKPEELQIVVCGSLNRNRSFICAQFGAQGWDVSKEIRLPADWEGRLAGRRKLIPG